MSAAIAAARAHGTRFPGASASQPAEQRDCVAIEASTDLQAEHHQTSSRLPAWLELGVGAELARVGLLQGQCRSRLSPRARESISLDGADQRRVRFGSDAQIYGLLETLHIRRNATTFCAFLDIRQVFDIAWKDGALLRLHRAGVQDGLWHLIDDLISDRTASAQIQSTMSDAWDVEHGVGQGAVLSGCLFNILINGIAAAIKRACHGATCTADNDSCCFTVQNFLCADDIVILSSCPHGLQLALDAADAWAKSWRFNFAVGAQKTAVMRFGPSCRRDAEMHFHFGTQHVPLVQIYTYVGVEACRSVISTWLKQICSMPFLDSNFIGTSARLFD